MNITVLLARPAFAGESHLKEMWERLEQRGDKLTFIDIDGALPDNCDMLISVGGDGTFLEAAKKAYGRDVPVLGVNHGRMGFLSENTPQAALKALLEGDYEFEYRTLLEAEADGKHYTALNEIVVSRAGSAMLGVCLSINGRELPTYWADGLLVSTPSGSTAYSLSAGGPIVLPDSKVLVVEPIAPHNLNVRPMIVADGSIMSLRFTSRDPQINFTVDGQNEILNAGTVINLKLARFSLKRVKVHGTSFISALSDKLHWGEDIRNGKYQ